MNFRISILITLCFVVLGSASSPVNGSANKNVYSETNTSPVERYVSNRTNSTLLVDEATKTVAYYFPQINSVKLSSSGYQLHDLSADGLYAIISIQNNLYYFEIDPNTEPILLYDRFYYDQKSYYDPDRTPHALWIESMQKIAFIGWHYDKKEIFLVNPDGTDLQKVSDLRKDIDYLVFYADDNIYWIESGVYSNRPCYKTDLINGNSKVIYSNYVYDFYLSPNEENSILVIQAHSILNFPLTIHLQSKTRQHDKLIELNSMLELNDEYPQVLGVWWSPDSQKFILQIPSREFAIRYFLFDIQGEFLAELN